MGGHDCYCGVVFIPTHVVFIVAFVVVGGGRSGFIDFYECCRIYVYSSNSVERAGDNELSFCGKHFDYLDQSDNNAQQQCGGRLGGEDGGCAVGHAGHGVQERCRQCVGIDRLVNCGDCVVLAWFLGDIYEKHDMSAAFRLCKELLDMQR